jgi:hypothetical protein
VRKKKRCHRPGGRRGVRHRWARGRKVGATGYIRGSPAVGCLSTQAAVISRCSAPELIPLLPVVASPFAAGAAGSSRRCSWEWERRGEGDRRERGSAADVGVRVRHFDEGSGAGATCRGRGEGRERKEWDTRKLSPISTSWVG